MIPETFIQELLARVDIVDVVERYIPLKKGGANYMACCPFHSEKTPSFTVSPSKQFYHCFGCGAHGSAIGFVMEYAGLGFIDAVEELASSAGLQVPRTRSDHARPAAASASLTDIMARAARHYREQLKASAKAIDYLKARGLSGEIAARFGIGYAPDGWQGLASVFTNYQDKALVECGLVIEGDGGKRYDRFRDRIMFPIVDARGNVIGFGGRVIGQGEPKYLNSPETPLFEKGHELYGLPQARNGIRGEDRVIVVEGYMDVAALAQFGVDNAVATLGTATTPHHVHKLLRQSDRIVFCFDGDNAGRKAAWRALEASLESLSDGKLVSFLFLPAEHDPDSFVRERGAQAFRAAARDAVSLGTFVMQQLRGRSDLATAEGKSRLLHEARELLARVKAPRLRAQLARDMVRLAGHVAGPVEAERILGLEKLRPLPGHRAEAPLRASRPAPSSVERKLLLLVLHQPELLARVPHDVVPTPPDTLEMKAVTALMEVVESGAPLHGLGPLLERFRDSEIGAIFAELSLELNEGYFDEASIEAVFEDTIESLRKSYRDQELARLQQKVAGKERLSPPELQRYRELIAQKQGSKSVSPSTEL